jgi:hypothetical protein
MFIYMNMELCPQGMAYYARKQRKCRFDSVFAQSRDVEKSAVSCCTTGWGKSGGIMDETADQAASVQ